MENKNGLRPMPNWFFVVMFLMIAMIIGTLAYTAVLEQRPSEKKTYHYAVLVRETREVVDSGTVEGEYVSATKFLRAYDSDKTYQVFTWEDGRPCPPDVPVGACPGE